MHGELAKRVLCNHCLSPPNLSPSIEYNILQLYKGARKQLIYLEVHLQRHKLITAFIKTGKAVHEKKDVRIYKQLLAFER